MIYHPRFTLENAPKRDERIESGVPPYVIFVLRLNAPLALDFDERVG